MIRLFFHQAKESTGCCVYISSCPPSIRHSIPKMSTYYLRVPKNSMLKKIISVTVLFWQFSITI